MQSKSRILLNPSVFKYILEFRAASGLALALIFFFMYQATTKSFQGILKVVDSFFGEIISANGLLASELVRICDSCEKLDFERLQETFLKKI
jgi:hypothetical protein